MRVDGLGNEMTIMLESRRRIFCLNYRSVV